MGAALITDMVNIWSSISTWLVGQTSKVTELFWNVNEQELTLLGVLAIAGLGISVIFLLIGIVQRFLHFRG